MLEGSKVNKEITSKEDILQISSGIAATQEFGKITIRAIAQECGIALRRDFSGRQGRPACTILS